MKCVYLDEMRVMDIPVTTTHEQLVAGLSERYQITSLSLQHIDGDGDKITVDEFCWNKLLKDAKESIKL